MCVYTNNNINIYIYIYIYTHLLINLFIFVTSSARQVASPNSMRVPAWSQVFFDTSHDPHILPSTLSTQLCQSFVTQQYIITTRWLDIVHYALHIAYSIIVRNVMHFQVFFATSHDPHHPAENAIDGRDGPAPPCTLYRAEQAATPTGIFCKV